MAAWNAMLGESRHTRRLASCTFRGAGFALSFSGNNPDLALSFADTGFGAVYALVGTLRGRLASSSSAGDCLETVIIWSTHLGIPYALYDLLR